MIISLIFTVYICVEALTIHKSYNNNSDTFLSPINKITIFFLHSEKTFWRYSVVFLFLWLNSGSRLIVMDPYFIKNHRFYKLNPIEDCRRISL